jgi:hypothetical protein
MSARAYSVGLFQVPGTAIGPGNEPTNRSLRTIWAYWSRWWAQRGPLKFVLPGPRRQSTGVDGLVLNLDGGPLPAGLIQTSLAAPQLNLWDGSLWGDSPTDSILQPGGSGFSRRPLRRGREGLGHAPYTS